MNGWKYGKDKRALMNYCEFLKEMYTIPGLAGAVDEEELGLVRQIVHVQSMTNLIGLKVAACRRSWSEMDEICKTVRRYVR